MVKDYTKTQIKAIKAFNLYIHTDRPHEEMSKYSYRRLGKLFNDLPESVFTTCKKERLKSMSHARSPAFASAKNPIKLSSASGVISCSYKKVALTFGVDNCTHNGKFLLYEFTRDDEIKFASVKRLREVFRDLGLEIDNYRINNECEYIALHSVVKEKIAKVAEYKTGYSRRDVRRGKVLTS